MKEMVRHVPDAGAYAPITILIDERADGVHISYDTMVPIWRHLEMLMLFAWREILTQR
jgi:hypothetical protein